MLVNKINFIQNLAFKGRSETTPKIMPRLEKDIFIRSYENNLPIINETTQIPMHHEVNGWNNTIRDALEEEGKSRRADKIDKEFEKLPPLEKDIIVYRGRTESFVKRFNRDFKIIENAKIGDIVTPDTAYSYTALNRDLAERFTSTYEDIKSMIYEIKIPKGAKVSRNMEHGGEVLMPRGAKYRLLSKEIDSRGVLIVKMEYILPENN